MSMYQLEHDRKSILFSVGGDRMRGIKQNQRGIKQIHIIVTAHGAKEKQMTKSDGEKKNRIIEYNQGI